VDPEEVSATNLSPAQRACIVEAVQAVVRRDVERVRELMYSPWREHADAFWTWADEYGDHGRLELVMPPGEIEDWDLYVLDLDGCLAVHVEMWAEGVGQTDLTLDLELYTNEDGSARAELRDMHMM
jgi:hypothetical protein